MRRSHNFHVSTRAGRFIGVMALIGGTMSTLVLGVATPSAQAATRSLSTRVESPPSAAAKALSSRAVREAESAPQRAGWNQVNELSPPGSEPSCPNCSMDGAGLGESVAISGDTMVVGANSDNDGIGAAYVYTGSNSTWTYVTTLIPSDGVYGDGFGFSVAVSSGIIVVGSVDHSSPPTYPFGVGAAYVYANGGTYSQVAELIDPGAEYDFFGSSVAISSNSTIEISAPTENSDEGAVFVYTESGSVWPSSPTQTLTAPGPEGAPGYGDLFGEGLADNSMTMLIGAPGDPGATVPVPTNCNTSQSAGCATGAVYVYKYKTASGRWKEEAELTASNGEGCSATCTDEADYEGGDYFGWRVAITGNMVAVGAPWASIPAAPDGGTSDTPNSTGTAYVFTGSGASWTQRDELYSPAEVTDGGQDWFGSEVGVMTNSSVVVGAQYDSE